MKVRMPKSWDCLPPSEKQKIAEVKENEINKYFAKLQNWLMLACIVLHNSFGFGKDRCLLFLANWREVYRINSKFKSEAEQSAYLTGEMEKIFGKGGYPHEYIDKLEEM